MTGQLYGMNSGLPLLVDAVVSEETKADRCRVTTGRVLDIKRKLVERYRIEGVPMGLIREAIAVAEAQAWGSGFPHLFLPDLADEILGQLREKRALSHPEFAQAA
jgi:hypothetical protein